MFVYSRSDTHYPDVGWRQQIWLDHAEEVGAEHYGERDIGADEEGEDDAYPGDVSIGLGDSAILDVLIAFFCCQHCMCGGDQGVITRPLSKMQCSLFL